MYLVPKAFYSDAQNLMNINLIMVNQIAHIKVNTIFKLHFKIKLCEGRKKEHGDTVYHQSLHRFISSRYVLKNSRN
jgi:hypothetical protein